MQEHTLHTSTAARFGWFAAGHFLLSICVCSAAWLLLLVTAQLSETWGKVLLGAAAVLAVGAYFPVGAFTAARRRWTLPAARWDAALSVLLPTLVAWTWEGIVIFSILHADASFWASLAITLVYLALFLATPSVIFVFFCFIGLDLGWQGNFSFWVIAVLAVLLPPLLFAAGSFWQAGRTAPPEARSACAAVPEPPRWPWGTWSLPASRRP